MILDLAQQLDRLLADAGHHGLRADEKGKILDYLSLILRWNARINLSSVRTPEAILERHLVESIVCARALPKDIATLLDFGSGAGFPGVPIAICRPDIAVTLAESQSKRAAFLQEAIRVTGISARVHAARAEALVATFACVSLRAVDRMNHAISAAARLVGPMGWLAPMITRAQVRSIELATGEDFSWSAPIRLPGSDERILFLGQRSDPAPQ
jgi:16S rRNA (guanine527-N7)-methyltransferase